MAVVDTKNTLNIKIGSNNITLPIYEDYSDFYNGLYMPLKTFQGERYVPITPSQSEFTANAGVYKNGIKYYFLTRAFTTSDSWGGVHFMSI